jgi:hypothetical protein
MAREVAAIAGLGVADPVVSYPLPPAKAILHLD